MIVAILGPPLLACGIAIATRLLDESEPRIPESWPPGGRDDVQYFAPGPEFKLHREPAKWKASS